MRPQESKAALNIAHIRSKYRDRMLYVSFTVSGWSPEPEGQRHGCVLAVDGKFLVATGFNGPNRYWRWPSPGPTIVHAEVNAIINARQVGVGLSRCVAYTTKKPCPDCQIALEDAGVVACFWMQDVGEDRGQWVRP